MEDAKTKKRLVEREAEKKEIEVRKSEETVVKKRHEDPEKKRKFEVSNKNAIRIYLLLFHFTI